MAIRIDIPGLGEVTVEGAAQESTMQEILAAVQKSDKTKRKEETERLAQEKKLEEQRKAALKQGKASHDQMDDLIQSYKDEIGVMEDLTKSTYTVGKAFKDISKTLVFEGASLVASMVTTYDQMAKDPIKAGAGILQTIGNVTAQIAHIGIDIGVALGKAAVGWVPFIGAGLADAVDALGALGHQVVDFAQQIFTLVNSVLESEFQKRAEQLFDFMSIGASFAGGMTEMGQLANQSGVGIVNFTKSVLAAREYMDDIGLSAGDAAQLISRNMAALGTTVGKGGKVVRDELLALGYDYQAQGKIMAQYMAQLRTTGVNLQKLAPATLAAQTEQYAKHLKVISDITGQDAAKLMDQSRAEAQRGALMTRLTATQSRAFQDAYAVMAALPNQQGPKLQAALAQLLAGGTITDPVIAGNQAIMTMLNQTAKQVTAGNIDMVTATQQNLGVAANAYRKAGDSATDFATLMNPGGTSAVAQGMSQFGNALRQYRYDPSAAEASMVAADAQASASDGLTGSYVSLTSTMNAFQVQMESLATQALPTYASVIASAAATTANYVTTGIQLVTGQIGLLDAFSRITGINLSVPGLSSVMGGTAPSAEQVSNKASGAGASLATAQSSSVQAPTQGKAGSLEGTYSPPPPSAAEGGILSGSVSGFAATLHGTEAVVPLPDNRSIPVSMDNSGLTSAINQQTNLLNQILGAMNKNNNLTSGILQASM